MNPQMLQAALQMQSAMANMQRASGAQNQQQPAAAQPAATGTEEEVASSGAPGNGNATGSNANPQAANPFAMFMPPQGAQGANPQANPFAAFMMPPQGAQGANPFAAFGAPQAAAPAATSPQDRTNAAVLYREQLSQLQNMGFVDAEANLTALINTGGNLQAALNNLLGA